MFEAAERAFDEIAPAIGGLVKGTMRSAGRIIRDNRNCPALGQETTEPTAVMGRVGGQASAWGNSADQKLPRPDVAKMSRGHFNGDGASARVDHGVDFRCAPPRERPIARTPFSIRRRTVRLGCRAVDGLAAALRAQTD